MDIAVVVVVHVDANAETWTQHKYTIRVNIIKDGSREGGKKER